MRVGRLYSHLPYPVKVLAASARGLVLRRWRYGPETEELVAAALERDGWGPDEWRRYHDGELAEVLRHARTTVPYYRDLWSGTNGAGGSPDRIEDWPVLTKRRVREAGDALLSDRHAAGRLFRSSTSGTTGTPVQVAFDRPALRGWYAILEARLRRWNGVSIHDRWGIVGGQVVADVRRSRPPYWVDNLAMNQLYISSHHISERTAPAILEEVDRKGLTHLISYPSSIGVLARYAAGSAAPAALRCVISNGEALTDPVRSQVGRTFGCAVRDTYGMVEQVLGASECEHRQLHVWSDVGYLEVLDLDDDVPVRPGEIGRIVCTSLLNRAMPLVRYDTGDLGRLAPDGESCACGRPLPVIREIVGRAADMVVTPDGRHVFWLNPVFYGLEVEESQIVQEELDRFRVAVVVADGVLDQVRPVIVERMRERLGDVEVVVERCDRVPRGPNGKFRPVVSRLGAGGGSS